MLVSGDMTHAPEQAMSEPILHHDIVQGNGEPRAWLYVLHGIFGAGRNWSTVIRRIVAESEGWGAVLVDLRQHGRSQGFPAPHTIEAAAADLRRLAHRTGRPAAAVLGHSFGGKVALKWAASADGPRQVWVIDSTPAAGPPAGSAWDMLRVIEALPGRFQTRDEAITLLRAGGVAEPVAQWMATNLERTDDGFRWRFEVAAIEALMHDFFRTDLWAVVEHPPPATEIHFVKARESSVLSGPTLERLEAVVASTRGVQLHHLAGGHWLNADNPQGVVQLVSGRLAM